MNWLEILNQYDEPEKWNHLSFSHGLEPEFPYIEVLTTMCMKFLRFIKIKKKLWGADVRKLLVNSFVFNKQQW